MQTTELEKIERAKTYMDKLANGMNPLDDSMVPEAELINNVHLSRYFFFIPDALRQVIAKGGTLAPVTAKKIKKVPLEILFEKREQFVYSNCPVSGSEVARRINKLEIRRISLFCKWGYSTAGSRGFRECTGSWVWLIQGLLQIGRAHV